MPSDTIQTQETAVQPVPPDLENLLRAIFAARRTSNLYQPHHPIAANARKAVAQAFQACSVGHGGAPGEGTAVEPGALRLGASEGSLLVNGIVYRQTPDMKAMAKRLRSRGINSVIFHRDFDPVELTALFSVVNEGVSRIRERGGPAKALQALGVSQIEIAELGDNILAMELEEDLAAASAPPTPYEQEQLRAGVVAYLVGKSCALSSREVALLREELKNPTQVSRMLSEVANCAEADPDGGDSSDIVEGAVHRLETAVNAESPDAWDEAKSAVREGVALLPPKLRPTIFRLQTVAKARPATATEARPVEPGEEGRTVHELPSSGLLSEEVANMLRQVVAAVGRADPRPGGRGVAVGAPLPDPKGDSAEQSDDVEIDLGSVLWKLARMKPALPTPTEELDELMRSIQPENYPREIALVLSEVLEAETRLDAYAETAHELERRCGELIAADDRAAVLVPLSTFARHAASRGIRPAGQEVRAAAAIQAIGIDNLVFYLADLLRTATPAESYAASELVTMVSLRAPDSIVQLLSEPLPSHSEATIANALIKMGSGSVPALAKVVRGRDVGAAVSAVRILSQVPGSESLRALEHALESDDTAVRLAIVQCVGRAQRMEAAQILLRILNDPDLAIRRTAAESLGKLRFQPAVHALSKVAENRSLSQDALTERLGAIDALGKIGGADAIAALSRVLVRRTWLRKQTNDRVRVAAVRALAHIGTPESLEAVSAFRRDPRPAVRQMCQTALDDSSAGHPAPAAGEV